MNGQGVDEVWFNGQVMTMDPARPAATAFAVRDGRLVAVGEDADVLALAGAGTRRHDLHGRFAMPGIIDAHAHGTMGALRDTLEVYTGLGSPLSALLDAVRARTQTVPAGDWIVGGPWHMRQLEEAGGSPRAMLDAVAPHHPVLLRDATYHATWTNSLGLALIGITRDTPDPDGGRYVRGADGECTGLLLETAQAGARALTEPGPAQFRRAVEHLRVYLHRYGITAFKEAMAAEEVVRAYHEADVAGTLELHVAAHLVRRPLTGGDWVPFDTLSAWRARYRSDHVHPDFIKLFLDGVAPSRTAAFLDPYLPACGGTPATKWNPDALLLIPPDELADEVAALDRRGFTVKMHAVGDRAARAGLDAIEATRRANGASGLRHEIGHCAFIDAADHPRFAALGAVAEMSPRLWFPNPITPGQVAVLGPARTQRCHAIRSLLDAGAELTYGSDWPAAASDANPWVGLAGMLTRRNPFGLFEGAVGEGEAIPLAKALPLFTVNAARSMRLEHRIGALAPGRSADVVVLDKPLSACTPREIAETEVRATIFEGEIVHER